MDARVFMQVLKERAAMKHPLPLTGAAMHRIHLGGGWQQRSAGPVAGGEQARRRCLGVIVLMVLGRRVDRDENEY